VRAYGSDLRGLGDPGASIRGFVRIAVAEDAVLQREGASAGLERGTGRDADALLPASEVHRRVLALLAYLRS
jgi:hypothetical protein